MDSVNFYEENEKNCLQDTKVEALQRHLSSVMNQMILLINDYRKTATEINQMLDTYNEGISHIPDQANTLQDLLSNVSTSGSKSHDKP